MYGSELRTCGLGAVVALVLGAGGGFGWHYLADGVDAVGVASAVGLSAQREADGPLSSCPPGSREGPVPDVPVLPHANNHNPREEHPKDHTCSTRQPRATGDISRPA
jgi:hypothetical protein